MLFPKTSIHRKPTAGFTLMELLVVIAIIGILAAVVLASLNASRVKSRNAAVLSQMYEYQKALDLYFADNGRYPNSNAGTSFRNRYYCIGDGYTGGQCLPLSRTDNVTSQIEEQLTSYLSSLPRIQQGQYSSPGYRGCSDACLVTNCDNTSATRQFCTEQDYSLFFVLEGVNQDCGRARRITGDYQGFGYTWCQLSKNN